MPPCPLCSVLTTGGWLEGQSVTPFWVNMLCMTSRLVPSPRAMPAPYSEALFCLNSHPSTDSLQGRCCRQCIHMRRRCGEAGRQAGQCWLGAVCPAAEERGLGKLTLLALAGAGTFCDQSGQSSPLTHSLAGRQSKEAAADGCAVVLHG